MTDQQAVLDRLEIEALQRDFSDAVMMNDHERILSLFVPDGVVRIPQAGLEVVGAEQLRGLMTEREQRFSVFVQTTNPGTVTVAGDAASGRAYMFELIKAPNGSSQINHAIYHDEYRRTGAGWRFVERSYEVRYLDETPLPGGPIAADER